MKFYRLYAGDNGQSHFTPIETSDASKFFDTTHSVKGLVYRREFAPHILGFHRAPHRRWVITLSGSVDIGIGDGTVMTFGPGDVFLAEDTTGQGHTAAPRDWIRAYVDVA